VRSFADERAPTRIFADGTSIPEVSILPQNIVGFHYGDTFTVSVEVENAPPPNSTYDGVFAAEVHFLYNPQVLNATNVTEGTFLTSVRPTLVAQLDSETNWTARPPTAEVSYAASLTDEPPPDASGTGILLNVTFQVVSDYSTDLDLVPYIAGSGEAGTYFLTRDSVEVIPTLQNASYIGVNPDFHPVHNLSTGLNYTTIQEAINANETLDGQTIQVGEGTYYENIFLNKSLNLIGENETNTIIDGYGAQWGVSITSNNVTLSGFTIENAGEGFPYKTVDGGIFLASNGSTISDNLLINDDYSGIMMSYIQNNAGEIIQNNIVSNSYYGMLVMAEYSEFVNNTVFNCTWGMQVFSSQNNVFRQNKLFSNTQNFGASGTEDIDETNFVNGKPIIYWINQSNKEVPSDAGYVACINCFNLTIANLALGNLITGVELTNTNNSIITGDAILNCSTACVELSGSYGNMISDCSLISNTGRQEAILLLESSCDNTVSKNLFEGGDVLMNDTSYSNGIEMDSCSNNTIVGNTFDNDYDGIDITYYSIYLGYSTGNVIYHNNFVNNTTPATTDAEQNNTWDNGIEGNYWSDYLTKYPNAGEIDNSGVWNTPYVIDANNTDHYPLMGAYSEFDVTQGYPVQITSNSTTSGFQFNGTALSFDVSGPTGTAGFCRVCIPTTMISGTFRIFVNDSEVKYNVLPISNETCTYLYFNYTHSTEHVVIALPELPSFLILLLAMIATLLPLAIFKKRLSKRAKIGNHGNPEHFL
jgi:parallel beta-helix repeat protein